MKLNLKTTSPSNLPEERELFAGRHLTFRSVGGWEYVTRNQASGIVAILAITDQNRILLVEQYRPPLRARTIEMPSGLAGDLAGAEREALAEAAERELQEETGYRAKGMHYLTEGPVSAGLSTEIVTFFRAKNIVKIGSGGGDDSENIVVHEIPLSELFQWLGGQQQAGAQIDYKLYAALYLDSLNR